MTDTKSLLPLLDGVTQTAGRDRLAAYWGGKKLSRAAAMTAKCCECMGYFRDGRADCGVRACPLYPWMPYREGRKNRRAKVHGTLKGPENEPNAPSPAREQG